MSKDYICEQSYTKALKKAEELITKYYPSAINRQWLTSSIDSYKDQSNRVTLIVWEGSPAKGMVLVDFSLRKMLVLTTNMKKICEITWGEHIR